MREWQESRQSAARLGRLDSVLHLTLDTSCSGAGDGDASGGATQIRLNRLDTTK